MDAVSEGKNVGNTSVKLHKFIDKSKTRLKNILERLKWKIETIETNPVDDIVHRDDKSDPELPPSCVNENSITTDVAELRKIVSDAKIKVPVRFSDLQTSFTQQQKLAIYEHVLANTEKFKEPQINVPSLGEGSLTFAEIVAQKKRETKKRRRYRQTKPTHIEEVRSVVDLQMQALQEYLAKKQAEERRSKRNLYERNKHRYDEEHFKLNGHTTREPIKRREHSRSRSRSHERKRSKRSRHRSRSANRRHKDSKHKQDLRDRSPSKKRKKHKNKKSRSKSTERSTHVRRKRIAQSERHKRRHRSTSHSRSRTRSQMYHRKSDHHTRHKVSL